MFRSCQYDHVVRIVVEFVAIDVVDDLIAGERTTERLLRDPSMKRDASSVESEVPVAAFLPADAGAAPVVPMDVPIGLAVPVEACSASALASAETG